MNKENPLVSIMIPTYNQEQYIARAIESALAQDYTPLEIVVSDDGSTDKTAEIVSSYLKDPRIKYFVQTPNIGRVANYRKNLYEQVYGEWVLNLDGDDYLIDPGYISSAISAVNGKKYIVMLCADRYESNDQRIINDKKKSVRWMEYSGKNLLLNYFTSNREFYIWHLTTLYKRELALEVGFYRHNITSSDQESLFRLLMHGNVLYLRKKVAVWQAHNTNISTELDPEKTKNNLVEYDYIRDYAIEKGLIDTFLINKWCDSSIVHTVRKYLKIYSKKKGFYVGLKFFRMVINDYPIALKAIFDFKVLICLLLSIGK